MQGKKDKNAANEIEGGEFGETFLQAKVSGYTYQYSIILYACMMKKQEYRNIIARISTQSQHKLSHLLPVSSMHLLLLSFAAGSMTIPQPMLMVSGKDFSAIGTTTYLVCEKEMVCKIPDVGEALLVLWESAGQIL